MKLNLMMVVVVVIFLGSVFVVNVIELCLLYQWLIVDVCYKVVEIVVNEVVVVDVDLEIKIFLFKFLFKLCE